MNLGRAVDQCLPLEALTCVQLLEPKQTLLRTAPECLEPCIGNGRSKLPMILGREWIKACTVNVLDLSTGLGNRIMHLFSWRERKVEVRSFKTIYK